MTESRHYSWLHSLTVLTACVALLPILVGAIVTTKDAGMAFRDWPGSDGHNMFLYPWLESAGKKFMEHSHRLAGIVIGLASIALAFVAFRCEPRAWVRFLAYVVLTAVVAQGLLGGQRVLLDERGLAFVHGSFAALVLALMASVAVVTSHAWHSTATQENRQPLARLGLLALATCVCVFVRFALVTTLAVIWFAMSAMATGIRWLCAPAWFLAFLTIAQLALGAGAWVTKYGFDGYVAVYGSMLQDVVRTSHVLCGMLLFVTTVVLTVRIARLHWLSMEIRRTSGHTTG